MNRGGLPPDKQIYKHASTIKTPIKSIVKTKSGVLVYLTNNEDAIRFSARSEAFGVGTIMLTDEVLSQFTIRVKKHL